MFDIILDASLWILFYVCVMFGLSIWLKRNDIADVAWGMGYVTTCLYFIFDRGMSGLTTLVYTLVILWGIRLSVHIYTRNKGKVEDARYKKWRDEWGESFIWRSFLQVYLLQGFFMLTIMAPLFVATKAWGEALPGIAYVGVLLWIVGFFFESVGDYQLTQHIKDPQRTGIMKSGLWRYTRHPNYFGEIVMWWALFLIVCTLPYGFFAIISPLTITVLLLFVSGIPMLEKRYEGNEEFEQYKRETSVLIPLPPK